MTNGPINDLDSSPVPYWQKEELDRRKKALELDPSSAMTWDEAKKLIRQASPDQSSS